jgi:hypothetical protein
MGVVPMTRAQVLLMAALAVGLGVGVVLSAQPEFPPGLVQQRLTPEMVGVLADGGPTYYRYVRGNDGGYGVEYVDGGQCARRPVGVPQASCRRTDSVVMGEMNRFPLGLVLGGLCERVACAIEAGDDPSVSDAVLHGRKRDAGRGPP